MWTLGYALKYSFSSSSSETGFEALAGKVVQFSLVDRAKPGWCGWRFLTEIGNPPAPSTIKVTVAKIPLYKRGGSLTL
ncbi:MAG: hypothetical protein WDO13_07095 [Verrucomicrobiota bacterium]